MVCGSRVSCTAPIRNICKSRNMLRLYRSACAPSSLKSRRCLAQARVSMDSTRFARRRLHVSIRPLGEPLVGLGPRCNTHVGFHTGCRPVNGQPRSRICPTSVRPVGHLPVFTFAILACLLRKSSPGCRLLGFAWLTPPGGGFIRAGFAIDTHR